MKKLIRESKPHSRTANAWFPVRAFTPTATRRSRIKGFGLIEFVCAVAILGILIVLGIWQYFRITENAKFIEAKRYATQLTTAAKSFEMDTGRRLESLDELIEFSDIPNWHGPYVNMEKFTDPWGKPYFVTHSDEEILITSSNLQMRLEN